MNNNPLKALLSFGNKKLPKSTAIYNMGSAHDCSSEKLGLCQVADICYAKKAERIYKQVLPYRNRQTAFWRNTNANEFTNLFLESVKLKKDKITMLRVSESGDFDTQKDIDTWEQIATNLKAKNVVTYVYTARKDLDYSKCFNLVVNGSDFQTEGVKHSFTAVKQFSPKSERSARCLGDCTICHLCATQTNLKIEVLMH